MRVQQKTFVKNQTEVCSQHIYSSFDTLCVQISNLLRHNESLRILENQQITECEFFRMFKVTLALRLYQLTNLDAKGTKRRVPGDT